MKIRIEHLGNAEVPMKEKGKKYPIISIEIVRESGRVEHVGQFD